MISLHRVGGYSKMNMKKHTTITIESNFMLKGCLFMEKVTLNVQGMSCNHCVNAVEGSVGGLTGIHTVKVNLKAATVDVEFNPQQVSLEKIKETIDDQGFDVK